MSKREEESGVCRCRRCGEEEKNARRARAHVEPASRQAKNTHACVVDEEAHLLDRVGGVVGVVKERVVDIVHYERARAIADLDAARHKLVEQRVRARHALGAVLG